MQSRARFIKLLATLLFFGAMGVSGAVITGDLDGDTRATVLDLVILNNYLSGKISLTVDQQSAADLNQDGSVTQPDADLLANVILGQLPQPAPRARNQVVMARTADSGNDPSIQPATWVVYKPDGTVLDVTGTTTQGLQEAINYCATNGHDLVVYGGPCKISGQDPSIISCTTGIEFPPMEKGSIRLQSVTVNIGGSPPVGMTFDSCMAFQFEWVGGQLVCGVNTTVGVLHKPVHELPIDPNGPVITSSRFVFPSIVMASTNNSVCERFDCSQGSVVGGNDFQFIEPNGGQYGLQVMPSATHGFIGNTVKVIGVHAQKGISIAVGTGTANAGNIRGNTWDIECAPGPTAIGVDIFGTEDIYRINVRDDEGPAAIAIKLETSARKNNISYGYIRGTVKILDLSDHSSVLYGPAL